MRVDRRQFLKAGVALLPLLGTAPVCAAERFKGLRLDASGNVFLAPDNPREWLDFRRALAQWRSRTRNEIRYRDDLYRRPQFAWSASNYSCCFLMICDERFLEKKRGAYRVDAFLREGQREFGGYDSVVLWHAYPRIGLDDRNQFDFYRDLPGALTGLRKAVRQFHRRGVRVYLDYNPWDTGTRHEAGSDLNALASIVRELEADGIFLDTMRKGAEEFRAKFDATRPGVILESEGAVPLESLRDHHASWAQWFGDSYPPGILKHKWIERRHMQHQVRRWDSDHTAELHAAWMNGSGMMVWENVFGSWTPWSRRDRSILRAMLPIQRRFSALFSGEQWTPLVTSEQPGLFASQWKGERLQLWTLVNRTEHAIRGNLLRLATEPHQAYFDLIRGEKVHPETTNGFVILSGYVQGRGIGCFMSGEQGHLGEDFAGFLRSQAKLQRRALLEEPDVSDRSPEMRLIPPLRAKTVPAPPEGMVEIPPATVLLKIRMRVRECGFYEPGPAPGHRLWDSYNIQHETFERLVVFRRFAMDETPVTNAQFAAFLRATRYRPRQGQNFLKHWAKAKPPETQSDHPVVFVDLDDARAYAKWAGKRLPTEEEWQYAAQGTDGRTFPWGESMEPGRCNDGSTGGTTPVRAFPNGRSPFGCYDLCGNVWHWTESERTDRHTRFCIVRGGGWFVAKGSNWYMDGGPRPADFAAKFLMTCPGVDRCATVGFRCVLDLDGESAG